MCCVGAGGAFQKRFSGRNLNKAEVLGRPIRLYLRASVGGAVTSRTAQHLTSKASHTCFICHYGALWAPAIGSCCSCYAWQGLHARHVALRVAVELSYAVALPVGCCKACLPWLKGARVNAAP